MLRYSQGKVRILGSSIASARLAKTYPAVSLLVNVQTETKKQDDNDGAGNRHVQAVTGIKNVPNYAQSAEMSDLIPITARQRTGIRSTGSGGMQEAHGPVS